ncbi:MAG: alpha/beta hydrolase [Prolixibacteraceae bacterium]|nr:alpha/beta hydrolase [Prolixibacteraceae bacterium]
MTENIEIKQFNFSGLNWEYIFHGNGNKVILFLNGGLRFAESASRYVKTLGNNFRIVVPTYPPVDHVDEIFAGIHEILKIEEIEQTTVIGQSYGGMIAQVFAAKFPDKVEKLILNSTASIFTNQWSKKFSLSILWLFMKLPSKWIRNLFTKNILKALKQNNSENDEWINYVGNLIDTRLTNDHIASHFLTAKDVIINYSDKSKINIFTGDVLIINGENDRFSTMKDHKKLINDYPNSKSVIIKGAGHVFALERPDEYKQLINAFINE